MACSRLTLRENWITLAMAFLAAATLALGMAVSAGAYPGDERLIQGQIVVSPRSDTPGWKVISGTVESVSGSTAVISGRAGRWTVDLSPLAGVEQVRRGEEVTVVGQTEDGRLVARGVARDTDAPSALPR